ERFWFEVPGSGPNRWQTTASDPAAAAGVRRLPTAVPLFESRLDLNSSSDKMAVLQQNSVDVARLFWGDGAHQVTNLSLSSYLLAVEEPLLSQTTLQTTAADAAILQTFGAGEAEGSWHLLASGEIRRGPVEQINAENEPMAIVLDQSDHLTEPGSVGQTEHEILLSLPPDEQRLRIAQYLRECTAVVLDLDPERVALDQPLDTLGVDSLMAMEIKNRLQQEMHVDLPLVELLQGPTLDQLTALLMDLVQKPSAEAAIEARTAVGEPGPLSYGQQAMWVLHQLLPEDVSFNVAGAARLRGDLDVSALEQALMLLIARHGALRTTFTTVDGQPAQVVHPLGAGWQKDGILSIIDAAGWDQETIESYLRREAYRAFDLEHGPLLRTILLRRSNQEHLLLISLNHLLTDFWSMSLLVQDIYLLYTAELEGREANLPPTPLNTADYAGWQREWLSSGESDAHRQYWHKQLAGKLPRLDLPTDRPRPAALTFSGETESRHFDAHLTQELKLLSAAHSATLATTLLAAFQILLYRYTGQEDLLVGTVIAGRERPELQDMVGYLINSVAMRADFAQDEGAGRGLSFTEFLSRTRQTMLDAIAYQDYPLPLLAEELAAAGNLQLDPSRPPLFETMFIMQRAQVMANEGLSAFALGVPGAQLALGDLTIESLPLGGLPAQFDLTLMMAEVDGGLTAALHYNSNLFDHETMQRMLGHLEQLLIGVAANPQMPIEQVALLPTWEEERLLNTWNDTAAPYPCDKTLDQLVSEQVRRTPHKIAVTFARQKWTYAQLEERANHVAQRLQGEGIGPGSLVALYVERSLDMMAGLLGILKTGGAYIPLDPDFPAERLALMLEDAQPAVLLTQQELAGQLKVPADTAVCLIEEMGAGEASLEMLTVRQPRSNGPVGPRGKPDDLAYVIYTSGSTGKPKGVQISHRAAVNFLWSMRGEPGMSGTEHMLAVTTLSFDIALLELLLPLISGAQVTIAARDIAMDGYRLAQLIDRAGITMMQATPATWQLLLEAGWTGKDDLKVLCGGEALQPTLADALLARCAELWNMYGPTETTVWSTICRIFSDTQRISIGRPIANTQIYVLDEQMQPVPTGVVGHLYIGGDGLSRGYLNRPQLTRERFVPHPFDNGRILYKTGDLARIMND
ncbi:MAG: amino acid adenylation domain-containing protein, partial [Candidatus Promineifilaceae bacterium]|nr:amino acid adenylation domain-containing protein [Candidatus Promineifilaceae bacterium]